MRMDAAEMDDATALDPGVIKRAITWLLRVQQDASQWSACQDWQRQHVDHARAWQRVTALDFELTAKLQSLPAAAAPMAAALDRASQRLQQRRRALRLLSLAMVGGVSAWLARDLATQQGWLADYRTALGERRRVTLDDGSLLSLNTDSVADVRFDAAQRLIVLSRGEILVVSGRDSQAVAYRPLRVQTRHGLFEAVGTRFTVQLRDDGTLLAVQEGAVRVSPRDGAETAVLVRAGERVHVDSLRAQAAPELRWAADGWDEGVLDVRDLRLDVFLAEVSRYRRSQVHCDPAVAALRVSGVFQLADTDKLLAMLPRTLPVAVERAGRRVRVVAAR